MTKDDMYMINPSFAPIPVKLLGALTFAFVLSGCGIGNRTIEVEDHSAGLVEFSIEKQIIPKLAINARYS